MAVSEKQIYEQSSFVGLREMLCLYDDNDLAVHSIELHVQQTTSGLLF
jgi:hypothetical protein